MKALLTLIKEQVLDRQIVIDYFRTLFHHPSIETDEMALSHLIHVCCHCYARELLDEMIQACDSGVPDPFSVNSQWVTKLFNTHQSLDGGLLAEESHYYGFIRDTVECLSGWSCFDDKPAVVYSAPDIYDSLFDEDDADADDTTYRRKLPKVGRNAPRPCGSGKKYKKCCLS